MLDFLWQTSRCLYIEIKIVHHYGKRCINSSDAIVEQDVFGSPFVGIYLTNATGHHQPSRSSQLGSNALGR